MWFSNKKDELRAREIEALEDANRLKREELRVAQNKNRLDEQALAILSAQNQPKQPLGYQLPEVMPGVVPNDKKPAIAMDSCSGIASFANTDPQFYSGFLGYPALAVMSQSSDYRGVPETTAKEMTREWGRVKVNGDDDKSLKERLDAIEARLEELNIRDLMRRHLETEMFFGRSQLSIEIKGHEDKKYTPLVIGPESLKKGSLNGFTLIEPIWTTPSMYNAHDPAAPDFFVPSKWFVMGKEVHADRLLTLIMRPVPDMLKPAYNFSGLSMIQLMQPYVERWQMTVDSIARLIHSFSITGIKTDMANVLSGEDGPSELVKRAVMFSHLRDNQNMMLLDKEKEEPFQINTPLTTLDNLMQKMQEQIAGPSHTPLIKLLGISPSGLNANSDGERRVYQDYIRSLQEAHIRPQLKTILNLVQLDLFGEINEQIVFEFGSLEQMSDEQKANIQKAKAERDSIYVSAGVLSPEEVREPLAKDEEGDYSGIDASDVPEPPDLENAYTQEEAADATSDPA